MVCKNCNTLNDSDALFCKNCGQPFDMENNNDNQKQKPVIKKVNKNRTKIKKQKGKPTKVVKKREKVTERKTGFFTKFLILLLFIIVFGLLGIIGFVGYKYYEENYNINVPNLVGMTYEEAELTLANKGLGILEKEITVTTEEEAGIVVKQNKKANKKVKKDTVITVYVGVLDNTYIVPNFIGENIKAVVKTLTENDINYNIIYEESYEEENSVIGQSISKNTKITKDKTITLTISKGINTDNEGKEEEEATTEEES